MTLNKLAAKLRKYEDELRAVLDEAQEYYDDRSEKWQEGEAGEAYQSVLEQLEIAQSAVEDAANEAENES